MPFIHKPDPFFDNAEGRSSWLTQRLEYYQEHCTRGEQAEQLACTHIVSLYVRRWPADISRALLFSYGGRRPHYPEPLDRSLAQRITDWLRLRENHRLDLDDIE